MLKQNGFLLMLFAILLLPACVIDLDDNDFNDDGFNNCIRGEGGTVTADLNLNEFNGIKLEIDAEVLLTQGNNQSVTIEAEDNLIDVLELDVQNKVWEIEFDECVRDHDDIRIFITIPNIRFLSISGSGLIRGENSFDVNNIDLRVSGSGDIDLAVDAENIDARISGSGKMFLEGTTEEFDFSIAGSGDYRAFDLDAIRGDIEVTGSGDAEVRANDFLDIEINGSGDVYYKGFPALDVEINGSGRVVNAN